MTQPPAPDPETAKLRDEVNALKIVVSSSFGTLDERTNNIAQQLQQLISRPAPGVPIWVVLTLSIPSMILAITDVVLTLALLTGDHLK